MDGDMTCLGNERFMEDVDLVSIILYNNGGGTVQICDCTLTPPNACFVHPLTTKDDHEF